MEVFLWDTAVLALQSRADTWLLAVPLLKGLSLALWLLVGACVLRLCSHPRSVATR